MTEKCEDTFEKSISERLKAKDFLFEISYSYPHKNINQYLTNINRCLTNIFKI